MKYSKRIKSLIKRINYECELYLGYVNGANECAYTDRMVEKIFSLSKELEKIHEKRFKEKIKGDER